MTYYSVDFLRGSEPDFACTEEYLLERFHAKYRIVKWPFGNVNFVRPIDSFMHLGPFRDDLPVIEVAIAVFRMFDNLQIVAH